MRLRGKAPGRQMTRFHPILCLALLLCLATSTNATTDDPDGVEQVNRANSARLRRLKSKQSTFRTPTRGDGRGSTRRWSRNRPSPHYAPRTGFFTRQRPGPKRQRPPRTPPRAFPQMPSPAQPTCAIPPAPQFPVDGDLRLGDATVFGNSVEGRVEIFLNGEWGTVCDDLWDTEESGITNAEVACAQLGFSTEGAQPLPRFGSFVAPGPGPIHRDDVSCTGTEESLVDCAFSETIDCRKEEDLGISCRCSDDTLDLPACQLPLESAFPFNGDIRLVDTFFGKLGKNIVLYGRIEVFNAGEWGSVCDDLWDEFGTSGLRNPQVACRQLGLYAPGAISVLNFPVSFGTGISEGPIWMDNIECTGSEDRLVDCTFDGFGVSNCQKSEDVGIGCLCS